MQPIVKYLVEYTVSDTGITATVTCDDGMSRRHVFHSTHITLAQLHESVQDAVLLDATNHSYPVYM